MTLHEEILEEFDHIPHGAPLSARGDYISVVNAKSFLLSALKRQAEAVVGAIGDSTPCSHANGMESNIGLKLYLRSKYIQPLERKNDGN